MGLDTDHTDVLAQLTGIEFDADSQTRADVHFETVAPENHDPEEDGEFESDTFEGYRTYRFALSQLLKFADLKKRQLKEEVHPDGEGDPYYVTREDASEMVMDGLDSDTFLFKVNENGSDNQVCSIVSPRYATLLSEEVDNLVQTKLGEMGIEEPQRKVRRRGFVVELDYTWDDQVEMPEVGDTLSAGISVRNSAFGASSLRVDKYYTVLACDNGMRVKQGGKEIRYNHVGDASELRQEFETVLEQEVDELWEETNFIDRVGSIEMELEDQVEYVEQLGEEGRITKTAAEYIASELEEGEESEWNLGRENAWNIVNALTGYETHGDGTGAEISDSSRQRIERTYNQILQAESESDLDELVG